MALERLGKRAAQLAANEAEAAFVARQAETLEAMNQAAVQTAAADLHATNMTKLAELTELEAQLAIPEQAEEINQVMPHNLECRSFSWVPYAPATLSESLAARDGLLAVRAWIIAPDNYRPRNLSLFVGLYHERRASTYGVPKLAVTSLFQQAPGKPEAAAVNLETLLQQDSAPGHSYLTLLEQRQQRPPNAIEDPAQEAKLEAYYKAVMAWSKQLASIPERSEVGDMLSAEAVQWELGDPEWLGPANTPMTLARHVKAADNILDLVSDYGLPPACIPADALEASPDVHQSWRSLDDIEPFFQPAAAKEPTISRWWRKNTAAEAAGMVARNAVVVIDTNEAYANVRNMTDDFYARTL